MWWWLILLLLPGSQAFNYAPLNDVEAACWWRPDWNLVPGQFMVPNPQLARIVGPYTVMAMHRSFSPIQDVNPDVCPDFVYDKYSRIEISTDSLSFEGPQPVPVLPVMATPDGTEVIYYPDALLGRCRQADLCRDVLTALRLEFFMEFTTVTIRIPADIPICTLKDQLMATQAWHWLELISYTPVGF